MLASICDFE
ncbi:hypothetical protein F383_13021 [Gossypium arboreum]|uniref:Uncharacterized protein n=1 Tax=Gossypium arboreum TaxID=29729 RepID=A0A0B0PX34_GOSAR|nr:hypothetical protein F383_13021 [Gossypium arboreum]